MTGPRVGAGEGKGAGAGAGVGERGDGAGVGASRQPPHETFVAGAYTRSLFSST